MNPDHWRVATRRAFCSCLAFAVNAALPGRESPWTVRDRQDRGARASGLFSIVTVALLGVLVTLAGGAYGAEAARAKVSSLVPNLPRITLPGGNIPTYDLAATSALAALKNLKTRDLVMGAGGAPPAAPAIAPPGDAINLGLAGNAGPAVGVRGVNKPAAPYKRDIQSQTYAFDANPLPALRAFGYATLEIVEGQKPQITAHAEAFGNAPLTPNLAFGAAEASDPYTVPAGAHSFSVVLPEFTIAADAGNGASIRVFGALGESPQSAYELNVLTASSTTSSSSLAITFTAPGVQTDLPWLQIVDDLRLSLLPDDGGFRLPPDYMLFSGTLTLSAPTLFQHGASTSAGAVPEPATLGLLLLSLAALLPQCRRRGRRNQSYDRRRIYAL